MRTLESYEMTAVAGGYDLGPYVVDNDLGILGSIARVLVGPVIGGAIEALVGNALDGGTPTSTTSCTVTTSTTTAPDGTVTTTTSINTAGNGTTGSGANGGTCTNGSTGSGGGNP